MARSARFDLFINNDLKAAFSRRALRHCQVFLPADIAGKAKPIHVLRVLMADYAQGGRVPQPELVQAEKIWERTRTGQPEKQRGEKLPLRLLPDIYRRFGRRAGEGYRAAVCRALMREYCAGQRDVSFEAVKAELKYHADD